MAYRPRLKTRSLLDPPPAVSVAPDILRLAVKELEVVPGPGVSSRARASFNRHQELKAHALLRAIDWTAFDWFWIEGGKEAFRRHDDTMHSLFEGDKSPPIRAAVKRSVAMRDGFTCRYCGLRLVVSATMTALERRLPAALPYNDGIHASIGCHPMQCTMRLTWDHVEPHAHGGANTEDNVVTTCGLCNSQKSACTLDELSLLDPRAAESPANDWDGLDGRLGARRLHL